MVLTQVTKGRRERQGSLAAFQTSNIWNVSFHKDSPKQRPTARDFLGLWGGLYQNWRHFTPSESVLCRISKQRGEKEEERGRRFCFLSIGNDRKTLNTNLMFLFCHVTRLTILFPSLWKNGAQVSGC